MYLGGTSFWSQMRLYFLFLVPVLSFTAEHASSTWSIAVKHAASEEEAAALIQDAGWPLSWISREHVENIVARGWWTLAEQLCEQSFQHASLAGRLVLDIDEAVRSLVTGASSNEARRRAFSLQYFLWPVVRAVRGPPTAWQVAFMDLPSEAGALSFFVETGWPTAWISEDQYDLMIDRSWWGLVREIVRRLLLDCEDDDTEEESLISLKFLDTSTRRKLAEFELHSDKIHALRLLLRLPGSQGKAPRIPQLWQTMFAEASTEADAIKLLKSLDWPICWLSVSQIKVIISRSWWALAAEVVQRGVRDTFFLAKADQASIQTAANIEEAVRTTVGTIRLEADKIDAILDPAHGRPSSIIRPAVQWAQGAATIHMNIKYAARFNAPGALRVENVQVNFTSSKFVLSADGEHSGVPKRYVLELELYDQLNVNGCTWSTGSVGKMSVTLAKSKRTRWARLLKSTTKVPNILVWHDYQEKLNLELDKLDSVES